MDDNVNRKGNTRYLLLIVRQALLAILGGIEDYLGLERSVIPKHRREGLDNKREPAL